ncbi:MAG: nucleoside triphosphate pyrophosphohydrolase [candidate division WOR-3 bacterium]
MDKFLDLVRILRKKCPWDREQTLESLIPQLIEETYELNSEVSKKDIEKIIEEYGDILLTVLMMGVILEEKGISLKKILKRVSKKMIERHPHVFGNEKATSSEEVLEKWEKIKAKAWKIGRGLPALLRSAKIQKRASRKGFDWENIQGVFEKIEEELTELKNSKDKEEKIEELGDILFAVAHLGNFLNINPEIALQRANDKFEKRFYKLEKLLKNRKIKELSQEDLETIWEKVKNNSD